MLTTDAGKNDCTARLVLVALAEQARPLAFPSITTLRLMTGLDREVIRRALGRLAKAGLIEDAGRRGEGVVAWKLRTELARPEADIKAIEDEVEVRKQRNRDRKRKRSNGEQSSTVLSREPDSASRLNTAESTVLSQESTVLSQDSTTQNSTEPEGTSYEPVNEPLSAERATADADARLFESPDGRPTKRRKPAKAKAPNPIGEQAQELATRYYEAMSKMVAFVGVRQIVKQALGPFTYEQVRDALDHMSTVDRGRPLTRQTLLAAIETPNGRRANGHRPYRDPEDQSVYDEPLH